MYWVSVSSRKETSRFQPFIEAHLVAGVVDLAEEVLGLIGITVLSEPEGEDGEVANEKDGKDTEVVNAEPFVGTLGGNGGSGGEDGGHEPGGDGGYGLHYLGLVGCREGGLNDIGCGNSGYKTCEENMIKNIHNQTSHGMNELSGEAQQSKRSFAEQNNNHPMRV